MSLPDYRPYLPTEKRDPTVTARGHTETRMQGERPQGLFAAWRALFEKPFRGITTDGTAKPGLFALKPERTDRRCYRCGGGADGSADTGPERSDAFPGRLRSVA